MSNMKKVVVFGGGTGLSYLLPALKEMDIDLTVVVTTSDNGGSTGKIRDYYNIPAPGDLRRAVIALSDKKEIEKIMNYRFDEHIGNHTIGNLVLTALMDIHQEFSVAVNEYCKMLGVSHKVFPVSDESHHISAIMENGQIITGETQIADSDLNIEYLFFGEKSKATKVVERAVEAADFIVFSPGSLFSSIIANIIYENILDIMPETKAKKIYISNLMTEVGESRGFTLSDHIDMLERHMCGTKIDYVLANNNFDQDNLVTKNYEEEEATFVEIDYANIPAHTKVIENNYLSISKDGHFRHNIDVVSYDLLKVFKEDDEQNN